MAYKLRQLQIEPVCEHILAQKMKEHIYKEWKSC